MDATPLSTTILPHSPRRLPDWRWHRAKSLARENRRPNQYDDGVIRYAKAFCQVLDERGPAGDEESVCYAYPDYFWAWELYVNRSNPGIRVEVESRILADESVQSISDKTAFPERSIQLYEQLFFNVRDRLSHKSYITHNILSPIRRSASRRPTQVSAMPAGLTGAEGTREEQRFDILSRYYTPEVFQAAGEGSHLWPVLGYSYGPHLVDLFVYGVYDPPRPTTSGGVMAAMEADGYTTLARKQLMAVRDMPVIGGMEFNVAAAYAKLREINLKSGVGDGETASVLNDIGRIFSEYNYSPFDAPKDAAFVQARMAGRDIPIRDMVTHDYSVMQAPSAFEQVASSGSAEMTTQLN